MDDLLKRPRDTSRFTKDRRTAQLLRSAIGNCNARLARCRAVAALSKPGYARAVLEECRGLRSAVADLRKQLAQIVSALPGDQHGDSRVRDTRLALDKLEIGIEGVLELAAANTAGTADPGGGAASGLQVAEGGKAGDGQSSAAS